VKARVVVAGTGASLPGRRVRNDEIEARLGVEPGWVERRTGIVERPVAGPGEATSDLAVRAVRTALEDAGVDAGRPGLLLLATSTPDHPLPPSAPAVAHRLGMFSAGAVDLAGACSGFLYGLVLGAGYADATGVPVVVAAANVLSRRSDPGDPATAGLFADGAGAVVLAPGADGGPGGILGTSLASDGSLADAIMVPAGGSRMPVTHEALTRREQFMRMRRGPGLFREAVRAMAQAGMEALKAAGLEPADVDWWVPHQAGMRLMADAGRALGIGPSKTIDVVARTGNSSAATIPIALAAAARDGRLQRGQIALLTAVGAGLTSAGVVLRW
jgi:3-oxoacyl-[acyl-carrier-protein] synthase-3